jgi:hypothetical protein
MTGLTWERREPPLAPAAVLARGGAVAVLARRVADDAAPERFRAAGTPGWLLVFGDEAVLPWVPGVAYVGWDGPMLLPTTRRPTMPVDLISRALPRGGSEDVTLLLPDATLTVTVPTRPVDVASLAALATEPR